MPLPLTPPAPPAIRLIAIAASVCLSTSAVLAQAPAPAPSAASPSVTAQTVATGLQHPCAVAFLPEGRFLEATAFAYVVPLVGLLLGIGLGWLLGGGADGYTVLGAVLGLGLSAVVLRVVDKRVSGRPEWTPHITAVYDEAPDLDSIGCHAE